MIYIQTIWNHNFSTEPIFLYYEININGFVDRQIEIFSDFSFALTSDTVCIGNSFLSPIKFNIDEIINQNDDEITTFKISKEQFDYIWRFFLSRHDKFFNQTNI